MDSSDICALDEKRSAALNSVFAAVALTLLKVIVGVATNSLGILAEAAHSGLDLVAALMTFFAVQAAGKPADSEHLFGHGKVENLSALFETLLLLATSAWIVHEALQRLFVKEVAVEASLWAFAVMVVSIVVDVSRSRMLFRAARKHNSQALEADALHFRTDIWSSSVVIVGLAGVWLAGRFPSYAFLVHADGAAAIIVALIVVYVSVRLGWQTVQALVDAAPTGLAEKIRSAVEVLPGITDCHQVRVRPSGAHWFVDLHVTMDGGLSLQAAHAVTEDIEHEISKLVQQADVTVHVEPAASGVGPR